MTMKNISRFRTLLSGALLIAGMVFSLAAQPSVSQTAASPLAFPPGFPGPQPVRAPMGLYATFLLDSAVKSAETAAYPSGVPTYPNPTADAILIKYFTTLLDNPAISGLAPQIPWSLLSQSDPGLDPFHPAAGAYTWNPLDDLFVATDLWNRTHTGLAPKTIQLIPSAGYNSPLWIFDTIDASVCGGGKECAGAGSCDGLFTNSSANSVSHQCGYTTLFFKSEGSPNAQLQFPLPWNSVYKSDFRNYLISLNLRVQQEPGSSDFVSISMAGPTASSAEMILPNSTDQKPYACPGGGLYLDETFKVDGNPVCPPAVPEFDVPAAWNLLFANFYGSDPKFQNTDLPFIQEWDSAIDEYSWIFSGTTLALVTTTDGLPSFPVEPTSPLLIPAQGFESDCGNDPTTNPLNYNASDAMACAAVTQVLTHYVNPFVGGNNAKLTFEAGMTASRDGIDLGTNGIKWLSAMTANGQAPLPGTPFRMSRMLGGLQFSHTFSDRSEILADGCPDYGPGNLTPITCNNLTPSEGLENVLSLSFFPGTPVAPLFCPFTTDSGTYECGSTSVNDSSAGGNFNFSNAPVNFLEIYDKDVLYASGLSQCSFVDITGRPASPGVTAMPPNLTACAALSPPDASDAQSELNVASQKLLSIAEPNAP